MIPAEHIKSLLEGFPENSKPVFAFSTVESFESFYRDYQKIKDKNSHVRFLSLNYFLSKWLVEKRIEHDCIDAEALGEEHAQIIKRSEDCAKTWFRENKNGRDFTEYEGLPLGLCLELHTTHFFHTIFRCTADIRAYLKRVAPNALCYIHSGASGFQVFDSLNLDVFKNLLPTLCREKIIDFHEINVSTPSVTQGNGFASYFESAPPIKLYGVEIRLPKFLYFALKTAFILAKNVPAKAGCHSQKPNILFAGPTTVNYLGPGLMEKIIQSNRFNLFVCEGESRQAQIVNLTSNSPIRYWAKQIRKRKLQRVFRKKFQADREKIERTTQCAGLPTGTLFSSYFESLYCNQFPELVIHAEQVKNQLVKSKACAIISHTENAPFERVALLVGNALSIPAICFQHGLYCLTQSRRIASYLFLWGNVNREFKISAGMEARHLKVVGRSTGQPAENFEASQPLNINSPGTMLLILNTARHFRIDKFTFADNERILKLCLEMIQAFPSKKLIIKPRYDDLQVDVYKKMMASANAANAIISAQPILGLLQTCDIFFHAESTAALEGLLLGKLGIQLRFVFKDKAPFNRFPFVDYEANVPVDDPEPSAVIETVKNVYQSKTLQEKLMKGGEKFLRDHANWGCGDAAQNFIEALASLTSTGKRSANQTGYKE